MCDRLVRLRPHVRTLFDFVFFTKSAYSENAGYGIETTSGLFGTASTKISCRSSTETALDGSTGDQRSLIAHFR